MKKPQINEASALAGLGEMQYICRCSSYGSILSLLNTTVQEPTGLRVIIRKSLTIRPVCTKIWQRVESQDLPYLECKAVVSAEPDNLMRTGTRLKRHTVQREQGISVSMGSLCPKNLN